MGEYVYLSKEWNYGAPKIAIFEILEWESKFTLVLNTAKNSDYIKKGLNKNRKISYKKLSGRIYLSFLAPKTFIFEILEWESRFILGLKAAKKYRLYKKKKLQIKIVWNSIYYQKLSERICLSLTWNGGH